MVTRKIATFALTLALVLLSFVSVTGVQAAKKTPKKASVVASASVARNRQSVTLYMANLQKTKSVQYELSYVTDGKPEGAGGTIASKGKYSLSRKLLFGTCSNKVCRYHTKIKNAVLTVIFTFQDGTTLTKTFKLRV